MTDTPIKPKRTWKVTKRSLLDRIAELESALRGLKEGNDTLHAELEAERSLTPRQRFKRWVQS